VAAGLAIGLAQLAQESPVAGLQLYVVAPLAVSLVDAPWHTASVPLTLIEGSWLTATVTLEELTHPSVLVPTTV
jgi:hypothetical protein